MNRKITIAACVLWIVGLAGFIIGLNIPGDAGKWLTVIGQIVFLLGLGLEGVLYFRKKNAERKQESKEPEDPGRTDSSRCSE